MDSEWRLVRESVGRDPAVIEINQTCGDPPPPQQGMNMASLGLFLSQNAEACSLFSLA
jgi:hypothetical protein